MKRIFFIVLLAVLFFSAGFYFSRIIQEDENKDREEFRVGLYKYINPLLECEIMNREEKETLEPLRKKIKNIVEENIENNTIKNSSIYFRDLNNGPWFGINEKEEFVPASLLKVPMLLLILKISESEVGFLEETFFYSGEYEEKDNLFDNQKSLVASSTYSVEEMINKMIIYSDNKSWKFLQRIVKEKSESENVLGAMAELGIIMPLEESEEYSISAKKYSAMFRVLYNASFLNRSNSELALKIMTKADFDDGIAKSLPNDIIVANKFGFNSNPDSEFNQLHDCGIIYHPKSPYLLCIMSKYSKDEAKPSLYIDKISKTVYDYFNN